jgi:DNA polymerase-3 subunit delta'
MSVFPWQMSQWDRVLNQVRDKKVPHAFLLNGVEGIGKRQFAEALASFLLCEEAIAGKQSSACGQCKQCRLVQSETHPDFKHICPEEGSSVLKVDAIRSMVEFFAQSSMQGGRKLAVLEPAEALNHNAANALLKTLEEPSGDSVIILVSHSAGQLLPTIRSRCQVIDFSLPDRNIAQQWLEAAVARESNEASFENLNSLLSLAAYAPLRALEFYRSGALEENNLMLDEMASFLRRDVLSVSLAERWGDDLAILRLEWMIQWLELVLKVKLAEVSVDGIPASKMISHLAKVSQESQILDIYSSALDQMRLLLGSSNPNKQLVFESLLNKWAGLMLKKTA